VASLSQGRTAAAQCGLFSHKSVPVIFEPPCNIHYTFSVPFLSPPRSLELTTLETVIFTGEAIML